MNEMNGMGSGEDFEGIRTPSRGVIYLAFGITYLLQALNSLATLRLHNKTIPVIIVTNVEVDISEPGLEIKYFEEPNSANRLYKTSILKYTPFAETVLIDADTEVYCDLSLGFDFLRRCDVAMRPEGTPMSKTKREFDPKGAAELIRSMGEFNSGVVFFRKNERVERLFECWNRAQSSGGSTRDQRNLLRALAQVAELSVWPLPPAWNYLRNDFRTLPWKQQIHSPFIWHYINFGFAPGAYFGSLREAKRYGIPSDEMRRWPYVWRHLAKPLLTRYFRGVTRLRPWLLRPFP